MFDAQLLFAPNAEPGLEVFSPWFPRRGDYVRVTVDIVAVEDATLTIELATKNSEDTGDGSVIATSMSAASVGRVDEEWGPDELEELVRYKFTALGETSDAWVLFRMLTPVWFDAVKG